MFMGLWARITGKDRRQKYPVQQGSSLQRSGDYTIIMPYGMTADLPDNTLLRVIAPGVAIPVTTTRPGDAATGEPVFFHPATNTRIIARNNGDLDIIAGNVNVECNQANINAAESVNIDSPITNLGVGGKVIARHDDPIVDGKIVASGVNNSL